ncbi:MAG: hypothetical protein K940chlam7_01261 [Chlamydiae bacterium]|nr:hypothetical protein [Chlamydiota bacterium]
MKKINDSSLIFVTIQVTISGTMAPAKNVKNQRAEGLKVDSPGSSEGSLRPERKPG